MIIHEEELYSRKEMETLQLIAFKGNGGEGV